MQEILKVRIGCTLQHGGVVYNGGDLCPPLTRQQELFHAANIEIVEVETEILPKSETVKLETETDADTHTPNKRAKNN